MSIDLVITLCYKTLELAILVAAPMLLFGLVVGLIISIFQAVTQIQEMTLTFVPKIFAVILAIAIFMPWILNLMISFTTNLFNNLCLYIGK